jgi:dihydroneopterin aldolase
MTTLAIIELKDLRIHAAIGTYGPGDVVPDEHRLDLSLWIDQSLVLIKEDLMKHVFDYDPLVKEVDRLARDSHYETQERLMTLIVKACAEYSQIKRLEIALRKSPVLNESGSLGLRLSVDAEMLNQLR